jgi:hypothetical protein
MDIPLEFIRVELRDVLLSTVVLIFLLITYVYVVVDIGSRYLRMPEHPGQLLLFIFVVLLVAIVGPLVLMYQDHLDRFRFEFAALMIIFTVLFVLPLIFPRSIHGYWNRVEAWWHWSPPVLPKPQEPISIRAERKYGFPVILVSFIVLLIYFHSYSFGAASALNKEEYLVIRGTQQAVLAIYGSHAIVAPYEDKHFVTRFRIVDIQDDPELEFELRRIGPLQPDARDR